MPSSSHAAASAASARTVDSASAAGSEDIATSGATVAVAAAARAAAAVRGSGEPSSTARATGPGEGVSVRRTVPRSAAGRAAGTRGGVASSAEACWRRLGAPCVGGGGGEGGAADACGALSGRAAAQEGDAGAALLWAKGAEVGRTRAERYRTLVARHPFHILRRAVQDVCEHVHDVGAQHRVDDVSPPAESGGKVCEHPKHFTRASVNKPKSEACAVLKPEVARTVDVALGAAHAAAYVSLVCGTRFAEKHRAFDHGVTLLD
eukprot:7391509-Prymnesium_polylepis.3